MHRAFRNTNQTAFVLGYSGEVGKELVKQLAQSNIFSKVTLIGRRQIEYDDERKQFVSALQYFTVYAVT